MTEGLTTLLFFFYFLVFKQATTLLAQPVPPGGDEGSSHRHQNIQRVRVSFSAYCTVLFIVGRS